MQPTSTECALSKAQLKSECAPISKQADLADRDGEPGKATRASREQPSVKSRGLAFIVVAIALGSAIIWAFLPTIIDLSHAWLHDPKYAHGYLVPVFAAVLLWLRRDRLKGTALRWSWWGAALIFGGALLNGVGGYFYLDLAGGLGLVLSITGLIVLVGGWPYLAWAWPACAFLLFMLPLPYRLEVALAQPLQRVATKTSTYALQTVGVPAHAEGNVIVLPEARVGVVEACSGLSMMMLFFAMATAVVLVIKRSWWEKAVILLSAVPIAIFANVVRIAVTCVLHEVVGKGVANVVYHDLAGWLMMPLALLILLLELKLLQNLWITVETPEPAPLAVGVGATGQSAHTATGTRRRRRSGRS